MTMEHDFNNPPTYADKIAALGLMVQKGEITWAEMQNQKAELHLRDAEKQRELWLNSDLCKLKDGIQN